MKHKHIFSSVSRYVRPLLLTAVATLVISGCKSETSSSPSGGGMPAPPPSGIPPPSGGTPAPPSPPGGESGSGEQGGEQPSGGESGGESGGGMPGGGTPMPSGGQDSGPSGSSGGSDGAGEVGSFPSEDPEGLPPPPSQRGAGGADGPASEGAPGEGDSDGDGDSDGEGDPNSDCGDTGALPGGIGGMGEAGECLGGGAASSEAEAEAASAAGGGSSGGSGSAEGGEEAVAGTGGAGSVGEFPEESADERAERLGKELEESIGGFDEVLMEEQQEISSVGRNTEGFGSGSGSGGGGNGGVSLGQQSGSPGNIRVANSGQSRTSPIEGISEEELQERTPEDVAVMVDDDIIARQLREAALAEEDPELRDRLWEEYRKYKGL